MKKLIFTLLCCLYMIGAKAAFTPTFSEYNDLTSTDANGTTWTYNIVEYGELTDTDHKITGGYSTITGISGDLTNVVIPKSFIYNEIEQPVNSINDGVFSGSSIKSVQLPDNWESIPAGMFYGCFSLREITIPESITTIGNEAFYGCNSLNIELPASVKTIGDRAFAGCTVSLNATDPAWLTMNANSTYFDGATIVVPDDAYTAYTTSPNWEKYVSNIYAASEMVQYPYTDDNGITWTYRYVLSNSSVRIVKAEGYSTDIDAPATLPWKEQQLPVTAIECSFANNENIVSVDLSKTSITTTPSFAGCPSLTSVLLPATLKEVSAGSFRYCNNLQTINVSSAIALEKIGGNAFQNCQKLQSVDLSATKVKTIEREAFYNCDKLNSIQFPSTLETIGSSAFNNCYSLQSIDLSATALTELSNSAFYDCDLSSVILPATLKKIGSSAFAQNSGLTINLSEVEEIGNGAFQNSYLSSIDLSSAKVIGSNAFTNSYTTFTINSTTPATIKSNSFHEDAKFVVSSEAYDTFCGAAIWSNWKDNISMYTIDGNNIKWIYRYLADSKGLCITSASGYGKEVTIPSTLPYNGTDYSVTHLDNTFRSANITSVVLPATLTRIGDYAFAYSKLSSINIPASVTTIGSHAFYYNSNLESVTFEPNSVLESIGAYAFAGSQYYQEDEGYRTKLASIEIPASVKSIGEGAFQYCRNLKSIDLSKVETIGNYAFQECYNLNSIDLSSVTSIGRNAFTGETFFSIDNAVPATIESEAFSTSATFLVPGSAVADYKTANVWSDYASRIFASNIAKQTINVTAESNTSAVLTAIGGSANQTSVIDLKVIGTINSYDIVVLHDKMIELRYLDLSEARIVANPYCYYENYCTEDDVLGPNSFREKSRLISIKLPAEIKSIGHSAFSQCSKLSEVVIPNSVTRIEDYAFSYCHSLQFITLPNKLEYIGSYAFAWGGLKEISFPTTLTRIGSGAFQSSELETVRIPSSLQYVGGYAFRGCSNLKKVYTYTIEPTDINEETFSNFETAMLYVPVASGQNYYWDEGWKRFLNVAEFDEEYEYFYLNGDHTLDESTGAVDGTPDADLNAGSGLTVEDGVEQNMGDLNIHHNGSCSGSIIAGSENGNVHADNLHVHINVQSGRWYFFCFPFDLKKENISMGKEGTQYIFRWYDGKERAKGNSGWKNVTEEEGSYLKAAVGYIFQCSQSDVLTISLKDVKFKKEKKYNELVANTAANLQDASWNFVGNPYLSYYDMNSVGYDAPITVWNGHTYEAIKPGDDDYHFAPFEAFFVQKPDGTSAMEFDADAQTTLKGSQEQDQVSGARSITRAINPNRRLVNIVLSNGQESDRTRIVFNNNVSMEYELDCDAAKFDAAGVPQLYTLDSRAVKYAINERPVAEGFVTLGYSVPAEGNYTLEAPRMDTPVYVKDNLTRIIHDFSKGNYEFYSEAGTFEGRFTILTESRATGIDKVGVDEEDEKIYNLNGQRVNEATGKGIYIKNNRKEVNM